MPSRFSIRIALALVVGASLTLTAACQDPSTLPRAKAGARCARDGAMARDNTFVLQCKKNRRWARIMPVTTAQIMLDAHRRRTQTTTPARPPVTFAPPTTMPAPPPPPQFLRTFGAVDLPIGNDAGHAGWGIYSTPGAATQACAWMLYDEHGNQVGGRIFRGQRFIETANASRLVTTGPCQWTYGPFPSAPFTGEGMRRIDIDMVRGIYRAPGGPDCYWETHDGYDGTVDGIRENHFGPGPQLVDLRDPWAVTFSTEGCGEWTLVDHRVETRTVFLDSTDDDPILAGNSLGYSSGTTPITMSGDGSQVTVSTGGWTIRFQAPTGQSLVGLGELSFTNVARTADATRAGLHFSGNGRSCNVVDGSFTISYVVANGGPFRLTASFVQECDGQGASAGRIEIDPVPPL